MWWRIVVYGFEREKRECGESFSLSFPSIFSREHFPARGARSVHSVQVHHFEVLRTHREKEIMLPIKTLQ